VTSYFLEITWIYTRIFIDFLLKEYTDIVNHCKISLNSLNETILYHFAVMVTDQQLANLNERKIKGDKFISNVYRARIDHLLLKKAAPSNSDRFPEIQQMIVAKTGNHHFNLQWCRVCQRLMTEPQAELMKCQQTSNGDFYYGFHGQ
jgi:hypothetical protein